MDSEKSINLFKMKKGYAPWLFIKRFDQQNDAPTKSNYFCCKYHFDDVCNIKLIFQIIPNYISNIVCTINVLVLKFMLGSKNIYLFKLLIYNGTDWYWKYESMVNAWSNVGVRLDCVFSMDRSRLPLHYKSISKPRYKFRCCQKYNKKWSVMNLRNSLRYWQPWLGT